MQVFWGRKRKESKCMREMKGDTGEAVWVVCDGIQINRLI